MVCCLHDAGIEVMIDVVYNHTAEGNHLGPDAVLQGHRQRLLLQAQPRRPALLLGLHRLRQHAEPVPSARAADGDGFAALLGRGDACRRLPLRPDLGPGARPVRLRLRLGLPRRRAPGPGAVAGQADRRALGPGRRRLSGRRLPARLVGVERQVPRHHAALLEGRGRTRSRSWRPGVTGSADMLAHRRAAGPSATRQLHHRA